MALAVLRGIFAGWLIAMIVWMLAAGYALPTLIGNALGGVSLVSLLNHAQVDAGSDRK